MLRFVVLLVAFIALICSCCSATSSSSNRVITILEYGDEMCQNGDVFVNQSTPAGACYSGHYASGSARLWCEPPSPSHRCVSYNIYKNARCNSPSYENSVEELVCSSCYGDRPREHRTVLCDGDGQTAVLLQGCDFIAGNTQRCSNCTGHTKLQRDQCVPIRGGGGARWAKLRSVGACRRGTVRIQEFSSNRFCKAQGGGESSVYNFSFPSGGCDHGIEYRC